MHPKSCSPFIFKIWCPCDIQNVDASPFTLRALDDTGRQITRTENTLQLTLRMCEQKFTEEWEHFTVYTEDIWIDESHMS